MRNGKRKNQRREIEIQRKLRKKETMGEKEANKK